MFVQNDAYRAQGDPQQETKSRQTLDAIIKPRLSLTAQGAANITATAQFHSTATRNAEATQTSFSLTATPTPTLTATATLNPTEQFSTVIANVELRLTQTHQAETELTGTAAFQNTIDAALYGTLGVTRTPTGTSVFSPTPPDPTGQYQTLIANVERRLTEINAGTPTAALEETFNAILAETLGFTPTPNATELQATLDSQVRALLTRTAQAAVAQTVTLAFEGTISAITDQGQTATASAVRALLAAGLQQVDLFNVSGIIEIGSVIAHTAPVQSLSINGVGDQFASSGLDNTVRLFDTRTLSQLFLWQGMTDRLSVAISPDGTRIAASSSDGTLRLWNVRTRAEIASLQGHSGPVRIVAFSPNGRLLASGGDDKNVRLWNADNGMLVRAFGEKFFQGPITALEFTSNNALLGVGSGDTQIVLWEVSSGVLISAARDRHPISRIAFSPDGLTMATVGASNNLNIWNVVGLSLRAQFPASTAALTSVTFSLDGNLVGAGTQEGLIAIWDIHTGVPMAVLTAHKNAVTGLKFTPDGARLLSCSADGLIKVWAIPAR